MSDDSFIREVDEELRSQRMQDFWKRYGKLVIGGAVLIVLATGSYRYYDYYTSTKAAQAGDAFIAAVRLATEGKQQEALAAFGELETQDIPAYRSLALLRAASELAKAGDHEQATKKFDAIANDSSAEENLRSIARIRAAMLLVDHGTVAEVESRVGPLTAPGGPFRFSAREALGLAYYKAGDLENAFKQFSQVINDSEAPPALSQRVQIMLDLIASRGGPVREQ